MEKLQSLIANIEKHIELSSKEKTLIASRWEVFNVKKRQVLLVPGTVAVHKYFVLKGSLRQYFVDSQGIEHTTIFGLEGWWVSDACSFLKGTEAKFYIEAMEDSEIAAIRKEDLDELFLLVPSLNVFFRKLYQNAVSAKDERILHMLSSKAEDRFMRFLEKYPELESRIPQYYIASYLGITPEFFSRMKSRVAQDISRK